MHNVFDEASNRVKETRYRKHSCIHFPRWISWRRQQRKCVGPCRLHTRATAQYKKGRPSTYNFFFFFCFFFVLCFFRYKNRTIRNTEMCSAQRRRKTNHHKDMQTGWTKYCKGGRGGDKFDGWMRNGNKGREKISSEEMHRTALRLKKTWLLAE